jgi:hypothetical protein
MMSHTPSRKTRSAPEPAVRRKRGGSKIRVGSSRAAAGPLRCADVKDLPEKLQMLIDQALTQGSTIEDTVALVNEQREASITLGAVESYFRSNIELQQSRIRYLIKTAHELKNSLSNPESAQADLAEAVLLTGLMGLRRRTAGSEMQHAVRAKEQQENLRLKEEAFQLKSEKSLLDRKMLQAKLKSERAKLQLATERLKQLQETLNRDRGDVIAGPDLIKRIQEVYGIISDDAAHTTKN